MMRRLLAVMLAGWLTVSAAAAPAQTIPGSGGLGDGGSGTPAMLLADRVVFSAEEGRLEAEGNVEILFGDRRLLAPRVLYLQREDRIVVEGPILIDDGGKTMMLADGAELSADLADGILRSARIVFGEQMQIAATELQRIDGRFSRLARSVASSCRVCAGRQPLWQIRATSIVHDALEKRIYFRNATLRFGPVPVFYLPRFSVPEPGVVRADGFLAPQFLSHSQRGVGVALPFFKTLGDYADITLTPALTTNSQTLGFSYRRNYARSGLRLEGALSRDTFSGYPLRSYLNATWWRSLRNGATLTLTTRQTSDSAYNGTYGFPGGSIRDGRLYYTHDRGDRYTAANLALVKVLTSEPANRITPALSGGYRDDRLHRIGGGVARITSFTSFYRRAPTTDGAEGRDGLRVGLRGEWTANRIVPGGLVLQRTLAGTLDVQSIGNDSAFPRPVLRFAPVAALALRYPLVLHTAKGARGLVEPVAQLVLAPAALGAVPNEDSTFAELDPTNLFRLDRFAGVDGIETGARLNLGVSHEGLTAGGRRYSLGIGRVLRASGAGQFSTASGLAGTASDWVVSAALFGGSSPLTLFQRTVFDTGSGISRNESRLAFRRDENEFSATYLLKEADATSGATTARSEIAVTAARRLSPRWKAAISYRHDFVTGRPTSGEVDLSWRNECLSVDISLSRTYASSSTVPPATSIGAQLRLLGFGSNAAGGAPARSCAKFGG